jgi:MGT family glycosyltransferase
MSKFVFFNIPSTGHVNPSQAVIAELVRRGHQVIYYNTEPLRAQIESTGATFRPYPQSETLATLDQRASGGSIMENALALLEIAELLLPSVIADLRVEQPDVVLHDSLAGWGKQAAALLGIPAAAIISTFALNLRSMPPMPLPTMIKTVGEIVSRLPRYNRVARRLKRSFGVQSYGLTGALMNTNALNIVYTSRLFQPAADTFDDSYAFVGPSITPRADTSGFPFEQLTRNLLLYISLGTINNENVAFYQACFAAFRDFEGQVVLSAGKRTDLNALGQIPANFIVRTFVPQLEVLQRADVFITHGGMNSVHEGLWYGVPLVVVPQQLEQSVVALQVVKHGAGVMPAQTDAPPTAEALRAAVAQVLANSTAYRAAAGRLGESFRAAGGYTRAAEALEAYMEQKE